MDISLNKTNLEITNIILSQTKVFTVEDIVKQVSEKNLQTNEENIVSIINDLNDAGILINCGGLGLYYLAQ